MTFEGGFIVILGFIFAVPVLLALARLAGWATGTRAKPVWLALAVIVALPVAFMLYLDFGGVVRPVKVLNKTDEVRVDYKGNWNRALNLTVEYDAPGESAPTQLALGCDAQTFDALQIGQSVEVRMLDFGEAFKFARLRDRSTFSALAGLLPREPRGPWREATAAVEHVTHVTHHSGRNSRYDLRWPYDVVQLRFTPAGRAESVVAVDTVEAASAPGLAKGSAVRILWPADDPRSARVAGARPGSFWKNWLYSFAETIAIVGTIIALLSAFGLMRRRKKKRAARAG
jgi:hypothetical protein